MNREEILKYAWEEKREKIMRENIYPLGVSITIEDLNFDLHHIAYGLLNLLRSDPIRAHDWSRNWGRTLILVHPNQFFSFKFTYDKSKEEKLGVLLSTKILLDPVTLLNLKNNVGQFKILLHRYPITIEGAILQVERMVDELVWCRYLSKKNLCQQQLDNISIYKSVLEEIWLRGISINFVSEEEILNLKRSDINLPIRLYGNVLGNQIIPNVIGAVLLPQISDDYNCKKYFDTIKKIQIRCLAQINQEGLPLQVIHSQEYNELYQKDFCVICGITLAKNIHVGHFLLLSLAELVREVFNPSCPLYVISNNTGIRIYGLVARIAELKNCEVSEVIELLSSGKLTSEEIETCYISRHKNGQLYKIAESMLTGCRKDLLWSMVVKIKKDLNALGFTNLVILSETSCLTYMKTLKVMSKNRLSNLGFSFIRYQDRKLKKLIIIENKGIPTAVAIRTCAIAKVVSSRNQKSFPIIIDADKSITMARDVLHLLNVNDILQLEGCAIGFGMKIASGSKGDSIHAMDLFEHFQHDSNGNLNFFATAKYFLMTRYATASGFRVATKNVGYSNSPSFYDYKDHRSFVNDFLKCRSEAELFLIGLELVSINLQNKIGDDTKIELNLRGHELQEAQFLINKLRNFGSEHKFRDIFPTPYIVPLTVQLRYLFDSIKKRAQTSMVDREIWLILSEALLNSNGRMSDISDYLLAMGKIKSPLTSKKDLVSTFFVDNLIQRGYDQNNISTLLPIYLDGTYCLLRKRCIYYEYLQKIIWLTNSILHIHKETAELIWSFMDFCITKLGWQKGKKSE